MLPVAILTDCVSLNIHPWPHLAAISAKLDNIFRVAVFGKYDKIPKYKISVKKNLELKPRQVVFYYLTLCFYLHLLKAIIRFPSDFKIAQYVNSCLSFVWRTVNNKYMNILLFACKNADMLSYQVIFFLLASIMFLWTSWKTSFLAFHHDWCTMTRALCFCCWRGYSACIGIWLIYIVCINGHWRSLKIYRLLGNGMVDSTSPYL